MGSRWQAAFATIALLALVTHGGAGCAERVSYDGARCDVRRTCPEPWICSGGRCRELLPRAASFCATDEDCAFGRCLEEHGFCVQCVEAGDCIAGTCLDGLYQCGCAADADCVTGRCVVTPTTGLGLCASCGHDGECSEGDRCNVSTGICENARRIARESGRTGRESAGGATPGDER